MAATLQPLHSAEQPLAVAPATTWPTRDAVNVAAALLPGIAPDRDRRYLTKLRHQLPGERWLVKVGPGGIQLRHEMAPDAGTGWEDVDDEHDQGDKQLRLDDDHDGHTAPGFDGEWIDPFAEEPAPGRRILRVWSRRSRSNMVRTLAMIDWAPIFELPGRRKAMVTLTYPGEWRRWCPDSDTSWRHFDRFVKAWERSSLGELACVWKREFQRRGAPHFHIGCAVPERVQWRCSRWCDHTYTDDQGDEQLGHDATVRDWVRMTWASIVDVPLPHVDRPRHELAGASVDFAAMANCTDPKRLAVYFTRHAAKGSESKEHQHVAPAGWDGPGRWWGLRRVEKVTAEAQLSAHDLVELRRMMRAWEKAQGAGDDPGHIYEVQTLVGNQRVTATVQGRRKRMRVQQVPRGGISEDGHVRRRWVSKPYATASLSGSQGGFLVVNDGPALLAVFAAELARQRGPGRRRRSPLP